jgi:hypothetical protein
LIACGGAAPAAKNSNTAAPPAQNNASESSSADQVPAAKAVQGVPTDCARQSPGGYCLPEESFVRTLCNDIHADVALVMFGPNTPWSRVFLTRNTDAWNASGGASVNDKLAFDEEVLVLRERKAQEGGMQVSGAMGSYDVLRWNGSCASLMAEEITQQKPPKALHSRVEWKWLSEPMQEALRKNSQIVEAYQARRKECKGVNFGEVSKKCEQLDTKLVNLIVQHVRDGGELATPKFP